VRKESSGKGGVYGGLPLPVLSGLLMINLFGRLLVLMVLTLTAIDSLWDELARFLSWWNLPWHFGGDFNFTHFSRDRSGKTPFCSPMEEFSKFIFEQGLMDMPPVVGTFTWLNSQDPLLF
jgi:hypothetical protein